MVPPGYKRDLGRLRPVRRFCGWRVSGDGNYRGALHGAANLGVTCGAPKDAGTAGRKQLSHPTGWLCVAQGCPEVAAQLHKKGAEIDADEWVSTRMKRVETAFGTFVDGLHTATSEQHFQQVAQRAAHAIGFRWFAYFGFGQGLPTLISSYPRAWTSRYLEEGYEEVDPVISISRRQRSLFGWSSSESMADARSRRQQTLFEDALGFGIRAGITVPIAGGFGRTAAFTLASDEADPGLSRLGEEARDLLQMIGFTYHVHADVKLGRRSSCSADRIELSQRECECLAWASWGKTMTETGAILGISERGIKHHLDNARLKLGAATVPQAVAVGLRSGLLR